MKLWDKGIEVSPLAEAFTVGEDPALDKVLAFYDCLGSLAHAEMLYQIGILTAEEAQGLKEGLKEIATSARQGTFTIHPDQEDVHTAIEEALTVHLGVAGKKIHTGRSRNDQVLVALRLYAKDHLLQIGELLANFIDELIAFATAHAEVPIPGRTHMQKAMSSSLGLWAGAFAEALLDDFELLQGVYQLNDQCPLGSAASYGVPLPIDRQLTADLLGFRKVQNNVLYANNSRGKIEGALLHALTQIMGDLAKLASDLIFFTLPEVGYLRLPAEYCGGSSLMPQKQNPDGLELIRAKAATLSGYLSTVLEITRPLPSGYHRDFQETKGPLLRGVGITMGALALMTELFPKVEVQKEHCYAAFSPEVFATDKALELAAQGVPFRDAYQKVARALDEVKAGDPAENTLKKTHIGAPGNLGLVDVTSHAQAKRAWIKQQKQHWDMAISSLLVGGAGPC